MRPTVQDTPLDVTESGRHTAWVATVYVGMVIGAVALFFLIRAYGDTLSAPASVAPTIAEAPSTGAASGALWHLLVSLTAVVVVGRLVGRLFLRIGQPPVIGEVIGGVLLGPSLLGAVSPEAYHFILAPEVVPYLGIVAQLGVVFYMFLVGLDMDPDVMRGRVHATVATAHASIIVPFVLGSTLALFLYPRFSTAEVPFTNFALFLGIAMSITAFPVLARILSDLKMSKTELGTVALTCAAVDDVTAWCLLALVVGVVQTSNTAVIVILFTLAFITVMFGLIRPWIAYALRAVEDREPNRAQMTLVIVGLLVASLTTEAIGIHALFGAFLFGAVLPHDSQLARALANRFEDLVTILLLPAFFAMAGMRTEIGLLSEWGAWFWCGVIVLVATVGKFGGTLLAARAGGLAWRSSAALGILMNTRGLMQLIVLNVGLDLGVITPTVFTMMVLMALATTVATTPILRKLIPVPS